MKLGSFKVNELGDEDKRRVITENFMNSRVDVLGVSKMHIRESG